MANPKIKFKRSAVVGKRPDTNALELGELAVNTYDGRIYLKRDTSGAGIDGIKLVNPWIENNANTGIACTYSVNISGLTTFTENVHLLDSDKLLFGAGEDLEIYHDGSHSYISDQGQGNLKFLSNNHRFTNADESKTSATFVPSSSVDLYYNNDLRFSTTGVGVTIWGETETRTLNVSGVSTFGSNIVSSGIITATQFFGDGSGLSNIVGTGTGVYVQVNNTQIGAATTLNFAGNLSASVSGGVASVTVPTTSIVRQSFTATSNQTSFTVAGGYTSGYIDIHLNGVKLNVGTDVTANDESNIVLSVGASAGDVIETTVFKTLQISPDTNIRKEVVNITEVTSTINVASGYNVGHLDVYLNGLKLIDGTDFTATNGTSVSLTTSAVDGDTVEFVAVRTLNSIPGAGIGTDGSVNTVGVITASSFVGPLSGNADTATRLAGTRTISGVSFNGSSNITLNNGGITNSRGYITNVVSGVLTATSYEGDGSNLTGVGVSSLQFNDTSISIASTDGSLVFKSNNVVVASFSSTTAYWRVPLFLDSNKITNLATPTNVDDAVNKDYVDGTVAGDYPTGDYGDLSQGGSDPFGQIITNFTSFDCLTTPTGSLNTEDLGVLT